METKDIQHKNLMFIIRPVAENPPLPLHILNFKFTDYSIQNIWNPSLLLQSQLTSKQRGKQEAQVFRWIQQKGISFEEPSCKNQQQSQKLESIKEWEN